MVIYDSPHHVVCYNTDNNFTKRMFEFAQSLRVLVELWLVMYNELHIYL